MKTMFKYVFAILLIVAFAAGCEKEIEQSDREIQEQRYFNLYMDANYPELQPLESGIYYIPVEEGSGTSPDTGDYVLINYVTFTIPDENVADTYDEDWARENGLYVDGVLYGPYKYKVGTEIQGMDAGVKLMKEGGISRLIFQSDLGYGATGFGTSIQSFESLMIDVELVEVIDNLEEYEQSLINDYLDTIPESNYEAIFDDETGTTYYYIEDNAGTGDNLKENDEVTVFYVGTLLDGREFDSNSPSEGGLDIEIGTTSLIRGWTIGLKHFKPGGTGRLVLPYDLAYGEKGEAASGTRKYAVPPFEPLLFNVTVAELDD